MRWRGSTWGWLAERGARAGRIVRREIDRSLIASVAASDEHPGRRCAWIARYVLATTKRGKSSLPAISRPAKTRGMTDPALLAPLSGRFIGAAHHFAVRIYYEDTDLSGIVYHANYLRYMERARSDMLRLAGIDQRAGVEDGDGRLCGDRSAHQISRAGAARRRAGRHRAASRRYAPLRASFIRRVMRGDTVLTEATVTAALLVPAGRPRRQPNMGRPLSSRSDEETTAQ